MNLSLVTVWTSPEDIMLRVVSWCRKTNTAEAHKVELIREDQWLTWGWGAGSKKRKFRLRDAVRINYKMVTVVNSKIN